MKKTFIVFSKCFYFETMQSDVNSISCALTLQLIISLPLSYAVCPSKYRMISSFLAFRDILVYFMAWIQSYTQSISLMKVNSLTLRK